METTPHVNELVSLLGRGEGRKLSILRDAHPRLRNILDGGVPLGDQPPSELSALQEIAIAGLHAAVDLSTERLPYLRSHLRTTNQIDLGGQVVSAIGSGSALGTILFLSGPKDVASVCAGFALIGAIVALWAKYRLRDIAGNEGGLTKTYLALRESYWQARELLARLEHPKLAPSSSASLIDQANTLARTLNLLLDEVL